MFEHILIYWKYAVTLSVFELEKCAFHINGVEIDKDFDGYQITLLVVGIPTKKTAKERTKRCVFEKRGSNFVNFQLNIIETIIII